jgi:hypothetical protein
MPEDAETEGLLGILDRLDLAVGRSSRDDEPLPHAPDALVVGRVHLDGRPEERGRPGAGLDLDRMPSEHPRRRSMRCEIGLVGEVLYKIATGGDIEELHAAADAEHREAAPARLDEKRELEGVAPLLLGAGLGVRGRRAVQVDPEVGPADQAEPVDRVEHLPRVACSLRSRR